MKAMATALLIASFAGITLLGVFSINCSGSECVPHVHRLCFASRLYGSDCPEGGVFASLNFHADAAKYLSTFVLGSYESKGSAFVLIISVMSGFIFLAGRNTALFPALSPIGRKHPDRSPPPLLKQNLISWLALLEHSPSAF